jgi:hypothetical protein
MFDGHVFVCWSIDFASFYNCDVWRSCICMLEYRLCLLLQLWCLTVMYLYVRVSSLSHSTIVMFDGHVFVSWSIDFASFYNCHVWRSCISMLEYRLCLLIQLWCLTVRYLYVGVSSLLNIKIVEEGKVDTLTYKYMTVKHQNCRRRQRRYSNIQIPDRQTSQLYKETKTILEHTNTWPSNMTIVEGGKVDTPTYKYMVC